MANGNSNEADASNSSGNTIIVSTAISDNTKSTMNTRNNMLFFIV